MSVTFVTGLWNIKRDTLGEGWSRSFDHYLQKFEQLLQVDVNLIIFGESELENFVWERRTRQNTQFIVRDQIGLNLNFMIKFKISVQILNG